jgi:hypothetical protein
VALEVEVIVDGRLDGGELLEAFRAPELAHDFLSAP